MIFLKKLFLRAAVYKKCTGQITVWMTLCFAVFLGLYLACLQSVWKQYQRKQAEQAVEAGMFSLFSEFEPHLFQQYDLFCLDTSFGGKTERTEEIASHLWQFTQNNITDASGEFLYGLHLEGVYVKGMIRLTDASGAAFFRQAVEIMKEKTGFSIAEDWMLQDLLQKDTEENTRRFQADCESYEGRVRDYKDEEGEDDEERKINPEARRWDGVWKGYVLSKAVPGDYPISEKAVDLAFVPSQRELSVGMGKAAGTENQILQKQWFISYLCDYLKQAQEMLPKQRAEGGLDYQLEYVIAGKATDRENLDAVVKRILLIREGMNYVFLLTHPELNQKAETLALVLAGMTGNEGIIKSLEQLILLGWAYGESLTEVRQLLNGKELTVIKDTADWQVPLSGLLPLLGNPGRYDGQKRKQEGYNYEACLRLFLMMESAETLSMRALDIIEGELCSLNGDGNLHLDHCVDGLTAQVWIGDIYLERNYGYE
ncbi:MAG: hypothetical protein HFI14_09430 [Lachnospiraceae bacterium]|nr:hypothetical protein [Lachnospiraceae bacterium]